MARRGVTIKASPAAASASASAWALAAASASAFAASSSRAAWAAAAFCASASRASCSSRTSRAFFSVASRRAARGSTRRVVLPEPPGDSKTEPAAARSSDSGALIKEKKTKVQKTTQEKKEGEYTEREKAYADTACGCFTTLRKRAAFAAVSSRLVAAAPPLGFFVRLPNKPWAARRF